MSKGSEWIGRWNGRTVACIASGPSLTAEDCEAVHAAGLPTIVTNTTFRRCLWADALFGFDGRWWLGVDDECKRKGFKSYSDEAQSTFKGARFTGSMLKHLGAESLHQVPWFRSFPNSGACAISLAVTTGAKRVLLLGFDCQRTNGQTHWHPDHPKSLTNAKSMHDWPKTFSSVAKFAKGKTVMIVNCSRATALQCFPRGDLQECL